MDRKEILLVIQLINLSCGEERTESREERQIS